MKHAAKTTKQVNASAQPVETSESRDEKLLRLKSGLKGGLTSGSYSTSMPRAGTGAGGFTCVVFNPGSAGFTCIIFGK